MSKVFRRVVQYVKYDLKEILSPTGLPDPPGTPPRKPITVKRILIVSVRLVRLWEYGVGYKGRDSGLYRFVEKGASTGDPSKGDCRGTSTGGWVDR